MWIGEITISAWLFYYATAEEHFDYYDYEVAPHGETDHADVNCLTKCNNVHGKCDACKEDPGGPDSWCCNFKSSECPNGAMNAVKQHFIKNTEHKADHNAVGPAALSLCVQADHFSYDVDGDEYLIPWHEEDADNDHHDCFDDCDSVVGECVGCNRKGRQGFCCPHTDVAGDDFCNSDLNAQLFSAVQQHYQNADHYFEHHFEDDPALEYTCVVAPENPCYPSPCLNNGVCSASGTDAVCACSTGFSGDICEVTPCTNGPCKNSGTCEVGDGTFVCTCTTDWFGPTCEVEDPCSVTPCQNGGSCTRAVNTAGYTCACAAGYSGDTCETSPCSGDPCKNGGSCSVTVNSDDVATFTCSCISGFIGQTCEALPCDVTPCQNSGECTNQPDGTFTCDCTTPYSGNTCVISVCDNDPCQNSGVCTESESDAPYFTCACTPGYSGDTCSVSVCDGNPCQNDGTCTVSGITAPYYTCACKAGYTGDTCEIDPCTAEPCSNDGTCSVITNAENKAIFSCSCTGIYIGLTCSDTPCESEPCLNDGTCENKDGGTYTCSCTPGYSGDTCATSVCDDNPCLHSGTCDVDPAASPYYTCSCLDGYSGDTCETTPCTDNPCQNGGTCSLTGEPNGFSCDCPSGVFGNVCDVNCNEAALFSLDCQNDFIVKLTVDRECFGFYYQGHDITSIQVTAANTNDVTDSNTCSCFTTGANGDNYLYSDSALSTEVTAVSDDLYFDRNWALSSVLLPSFRTQSKCQIKHNMRS